jgi:hypothetical protein
VAEHETIVVNSAFVDVMFACGFTKDECTALEKSLDNVRNNGRILVPIVEKNIEKLNNIVRKN